MLQNLTLSELYAPIRRLAEAGRQLVVQGATRHVNPMLVTSRLAGAGAPSFWQGAAAKSQARIARASLWKPFAKQNNPGIHESLVGTARGCAPTA